MSTVRTITLSAGESWMVIAAPCAIEPMLVLLMLLGLCGHRFKVSLDPVVLL